MNCKIFIVSIIVFVACLAIGKGMIPEREDKCRCITTESRRIGKHIEKVELFRPNSQCKNPEIIATLKKTKQEICLDPTAPWVIKVFGNIIANKSS